MVMYTDSSSGKWRELLVVATNLIIQVSGCSIQLTVDRSVIHYHMCCANKKCELPFQIWPTLPTLIQCRCHQA